MTSLPNELKDFLDGYYKAPLSFLKNKNFSSLSDALAAF